MAQTELPSIGYAATAPLDWLRRRDPGLASVRRAARVTLVACLGFYACQYGLHNATMATYALFGAFALGALSQIPGGPRERALTLIATLPVGWALVAIGTLLSVSNGAAAAGMFVLGFLVSYVGVGGPRLTGLAAGGQLLYILPCFPPYDPASLPARIAGLTLAVVLLSAAELALWPDAPPVRYERRLADALDALVGCLRAVADSGPATGPPVAGLPPCFPPRSKRPTPCARRSCRGRYGRPPPAGMTGRSARPPAPNGFCSAAPSISFLPTTMRRAASPRRRRCCGRRRPARPQPRPGCGAKDRRRAPVGRRRRSARSTSPASRSRPTISRPNSFGSARWRSASASGPIRS